MRGTLFVKDVFSKVYKTLEDKGYRGIKIKIIRYPNALESKVRIYSQGKKILSMKYKKFIESIERGEQWLD